jgi:hypothetical protein
MPACLAWTSTCWVFVKGNVSLRSLTSKHEIHTVMTSPCCTQNCERRTEISIFTCRNTWYNWSKFHRSTYRSAQMVSKITSRATEGTRTSGCKLQLHINGFVQFSFKLWTFIKFCTFTCLPRFRFKSVPPKQAIYVWSFYICVCNEVNIFRTISLYNNLFFRLLHKH